MSMQSVSVLSNLSTVAEISFNSAGKDRLSTMMPPSCSQAVAKACSIRWPQGVWGVSMAARACPSYRAR